MKLELFVSEAIQKIGSRTNFFAKMAFAKMAKSGSLLDIGRGSEFCNFWIYWITPAPLRGKAFFFRGKCESFDLRTLINS